MHATITIVRLQSPCATSLIGSHASTILAAIEGVSNVHIEHQDVDRATLSYNWKDPGTHSEGIDQVLKSQGMRRVR